MTLPPYAQSRIGRALVSEIIAEQPSCYVTRGEPYNCGGRTVYRGKLAGQLRRLHREWMQREFARLDSVFKVSGVYDQTAANAVCGAEEPDALIARLLSASAEAVAA